MKKLLMLLALVVTMPLAAWDPNYDCNSYNSCETPCCNDWSQSLSTGWDVEFRVSSFYPTSKFFRQVYPRARVTYGVDISKRICGNYYVWFDVDGFDKKGHSVGPREFRESTRINLIPLSLGLKYAYPITSCVDIYAGAGAAYTFLHVKNNSDFVHKHVDRQGFGGVVKTGVKVSIGSCWFIDLFGDYLYQQFHFYGHHTEVGGFKIGGGIGASF